MRAIVRYSFSQSGVGSRAEIVAALQEAGFHRVGTALFELDNANARRLERALRAVLRVATHPPDGDLDNVWIYLDGAST